MLYPEPDEDECEDPAFEAHCRRRARQESVAADKPAATPDEPEPETETDETEHGNECQCNDCRAERAQVNQANGKPVDHFE
jgi:hypothetical protein